MSVRSGSNTSLTDVQTVRTRLMRLPMCLRFPTLQGVKDRVTLTLQFVLVWSKALRPYFQAETPHMANNPNQPKRTAGENPRTTRIREIVFRAAVSLLLDEGAEAVTALRVSEHTGIARSTIYRH